MLQYRPFVYGPIQICPILDEDADDVLLALMEADADSTEIVRRERARRAEREWRRAYAAKAEYEARCQARQAEYERQRAQRDEWTGLLRQAVGECLHRPEYRELIPDFERDIALINSVPHTEPLPWKLDTTVFWNEFARRKLEIDMKGTGDARPSR